MPRAPRHAVAWRPTTGRYETASAGEPALALEPTDTALLRSWLADVASFAFSGAAGRLNVYLEPRPRGGSYWYAYHSAAGRTRKRYLGTTTTVTLARLEEAARALVDPSSPASPGSAPSSSVVGHDAVPHEPDDPSGVALPVTKLLAPPSPVALVARDRLLVALDSASLAPLTLVVAPAGWGKTTALAAWAARMPDRVAWLALEEADDEPARFWTALIAALRIRRPRVGVTVLALLHAPQPPPLPTVVTSLVNDLAGARAPLLPLILVLDDYHLIANEAVRESVAFLLGHLPSGLHLVIGSRTDPDLPLARLRAGGQLIDLRADDLRFSQADTAAFLHRALDPPLADHELAALVERTDGWAAGVQLAALALRGRSDRAAWLAGFTGGHRFLLDYVEEEILARQPPAVRRFLLQVAVLSRLEADLCAAVSGDSTSRDILESLERANLFVVPLDDERHWYRLHDLFREALLARAAADSPTLLPEAHRRAATWHAAHGDGREAIGHALAARDFPLAADLIAQEAPGMWLRGEATSALTLLLALPDDLLRRRSPLALDAALNLLESLHSAVDRVYADGCALVEQLLARLEVRPHDREPAPPDEAVVAIERRTRLLRALLASRGILERQDAAAFNRLAEEIVEPAAAEEVRWRMILLALRFWRDYSLGGGGHELLGELEAAKREAITAGEHLVALRLTCWLALIHGNGGRFDVAERECEEGLAMAAQRGLHTVLTGYLLSSRSLRLAMQNRLSAATDAARGAVAIGHTWHQIDVLEGAGSLLAYLALARADPSSAERELDQAGAGLRGEKLSFYGEMVSALRARCWLAAGDQRRAEDWATSVAIPDPSIRIWGRVAVDHARASVSLAGGRPGEALETLERLASELERAGSYVAVVESLALRLVALHQLGHRTEARGVATRLLELTEPNGVVRVFLDEGEPMERALTSLLHPPDGGASDDRPLPRAFVARLLATFDGDRRTGCAPATAAPSTPETPSRRGRAASASVEPLTRREREVLARLAVGDSNKEIAAALAISLDTTKKHVGNLLAKLDAASRTQAVARARDADLL